MKKMFPMCNMSQDSLHPPMYNSGYYPRKHPSSRHQPMPITYFQPSPYCTAHYNQEQNMASTRENLNAKDAGAAAANGEQIPAECMIKHPLQNQWTLWYYEADRSKQWEDLQNEITTIDTVEDFWSLYNYIKLASEIKAGSDYSFFKKGIRPMWEDAANKKGGRWTLTLNRNVTRGDIDNIWLDVILCLIGEAFDHSDKVCGAVINNRSKAFKISIWTSDAKDEESCLEIGNKLKDALRLDKAAFIYQSHSDQMSKPGLNIKSLYQL